MGSRQGRQAHRWGPRPTKDLRNAVARACDTRDDAGPPQRPRSRRGNSVTLPEAIAIATAGVLVEAELELEDTTPLYEVRLLVAGTLTRIHVHPDTGVLGEAPF